MWDKCSDFKPSFTTEIVVFRAVCVMAVSEESLWYASYCTIPGLQELTERGMCTSSNWMQVQCELSLILLRMLSSSSSILTPSLTTSPYTKLHHLKMLNNSHCSHSPQRKLPIVTAVHYTLFPRKICKRHERHQIPVRMWIELHIHTAPSQFTKRVFPNILSLQENLSKLVHLLFSTKKYSMCLDSSHIHQVGFSLSAIIWYIYISFCLQLSLHQKCFARLITWPTRKTAFHHAKEEHHLMAPQLIVQSLQILVVVTMLANIHEIQVEVADLKFRPNSKDTALRQAGWEDKAQ